MLRPEPLPRKLELACLGLGSLTCFIGYAGVASFATPVYQMTLGVSPILLGAALSVPRLWEAFADPLIGNLSDNTWSRWGRRRPFMLVGAVTMGVLFGLTWMVSPAWTNAAKLAYFTVLSVLFYSAYALYNIPYTALTYEISPDYHERTNVMAYCSFFQKAGELSYQWIFPASQLAIFATSLEGVRAVGWIVGIVFLALVGIIPAVAVRERFSALPQKRPRAPFWSSLRDTFGSRPFTILAALVFCNTIMGMLTSTLDYYVLVYYMFAGNVKTGSVWKALLSSGYALVGVLAIPFVVRASARYDKKRTLMAIYVATILGGLLKWVTFSVRRPWVVLLDPLVCGAIWIAVNILFASMLADICDEDELHSGHRREGMFSAIYCWIQKSTSSIAFLGAGVALTITGFRQEVGAAQAPATFFALRALLVASTALPPVAAILLLRRYPLDAVRAAETRHRLDERHRVSAPASA